MGILTSNLADLMRRAENVYIENLNGRETGFAVTGEQLKEVVNNCAYYFLTSAEYEEFIEICNSMGV